MIDDDILMTDSADGPHATASPQASSQFEEFFSYQSQLNDVTASADHVNVLEHVNLPEPQTIDPSLLVQEPTDPQLACSTSQVDGHPGMVAPASERDGHPELAAPASQVITSPTGDPWATEELSHALQNFLDALPAAEEAQGDSNAPNLDEDQRRTSAIPSKTRKSRANLPKDAVNILKTWLLEHASNPYPSEIEKLGLSACSGLQVQQVNCWFSNARKRILNDEYNSSASHSDAESLISSTYIRGRSSQRVRLLERNTSTDNFSSAFSQSDSEWSCIPRRGKKRRYSNDVPVNNRKRSRSISGSSTPAEGAGKPEPAFQCTFCGMSLEEKSWRRHEETQHIPQIYWKCMATGPLLAAARGEEDEAYYSTCAFCGDSVETSCPKTHRIKGCLIRGDKHRVFFRKEHLKQHVRNFHGSCLDDQVAQAWEFKTEDATRSWQCGFCTKVLEDWNAREIHLKQHFRDGATMDLWNWDCSQSGDSASAPPPRAPRPRKARPAGLDWDTKHQVTDVANAEKHDNHGTVSLQCPHHNFQDQRTTIKDHCISSKQWGFPFKVSLGETLEAIGLCWLWYCEEQSSLIIQAHSDDRDRHRVWQRYEMKDYPVLIKLVSYVPPSHQYVMKVVPKVIPSFIQERLDSDGFSVQYRCLGSRLQFADSDSLLRFASWLSTLKRGYYFYYNNGCPECPLGFGSWDELELHSNYHAGAHVDPFGNRLSPIEATNYPRSSHNLRSHLEEVEFKCGSILSNDKAWGCKRLFPGISSFITHLKSPTGKICCASLQDYPAHGISSLGRSHVLLEEAQKGSSSLGLPEALFVLYPALVQHGGLRLPLIDPRFEGRNMSEFREGIIERRKLSSIDSVSSRGSNSKSRRSSVPKSQRTVQPPSNPYLERLRKLIDT